MQKRDDLKFVIVGHVDHGKSTLIGRLFFDTNSLPPDKMAEVEAMSKELGRRVEFAFLMDHLQEEREQGITIDTTQIFFESNNKEYVIIDAPGHVAFVKNMITGASQAEAAVLIVDADEGMQEQTRRHSYILAMLGLKQVIVVINKMDLVDYNEERFKNVKDEVANFLSTISIESEFYIPISAMHGDNVAKRSERMSWYSGSTVLESFDSLENRLSPEDKELIFPIQDVYKVNGKRMEVGRVESGTLRTDQKIVVLPRGEKTTVSSIERFMEERLEATAGESIGITTKDPLFIDRGNVICEVGKEPTLTDDFKANVFWLSKKGYKVGEKILLKLATQEVLCKVESISRKFNSSTLEVIGEDADSIDNLEVGELVVKTKHPIAIKNFNDVPELGRFVLVRDDNVCAGGIITSN